MTAYRFTDKHHDYCKSARQTEFLDLKLGGKNNSQIAKAMGIDVRGVARHAARIKKAAQLHNYNPDAEDLGMMPTPEQPFPIKRVSSHFTRNKETGKVEGDHGWIITEPDKDGKLQQLYDLVESLNSEIKPAKPVKFKGNQKALMPELMNLHVITDYHLGQYAWGGETRDDDWNLEIAESFLIDLFAIQIAKAPPAEQGMVMLLGDFRHFDSLTSVTPASGHVVDTASRIQQIVRCAQRVIREVIRMALKKYETVHFIDAEGNHDPVLSMASRESWSLYFENESRVQVDTNPLPYGAHSHGKVMIAYNHGHKVTEDRIDRVLASQFKEMYGQSEWNYCHQGHMHHRRKVMQTVEGSLFEIEQHPTIISANSYEARGGYKSKRSADVITYHADYGEVDRSRMTPELVKLYQRTGAIEYAGKKAA